MGQFFVANNITDQAKNVAEISTVLSGKVYALLRNLLASSRQGIWGPCQGYERPFEAKAAHYRRKTQLKKNMKSDN